MLEPIKKYVKSWFNDEQESFYTYDDIPGELPLIKYLTLPNNCHLGQRKLVLNEIKFYTIICSKYIIPPNDIPQKDNILQQNIPQKDNILKQDDNNTPQHSTKRL